MFGAGDRESGMAQFALGKTGESAETAAVDFDSVANANSETPKLSLYTELEAGCAHSIDAPKRPDRVVFPTANQAAAARISRLQHRSVRFDVGFVINASQTEPKKL